MKRFDWRIALNRCLIGLVTALAAQLSNPNVFAWRELMVAVLAAILIDLKAYADSHKEE